MCVCVCAGASHLLYRRGPPKSTYVYIYICDTEILQAIVKWCQVMSSTVKWVDAGMPPKQCEQSLMNPGWLGSFTSSKPPENSSNFRYSINLWYGFTWVIQQKKYVFCCLLPLNIGLISHWAKGCTWGWSSPTKQRSNDPNLSAAARHMRLRTDCLRRSQNNHWPPYPPQKKSQCGCSRQKRPMHWMEAACKCEEAPYRVNIM